MTNEGPVDFLARLRKKAKEHKDKLSPAEEVFLEVVGKSDEKAVLGQGDGTKL